MAKLRLHTDQDDSNIPEPLPFPDRASLPSTPDATHTRRLATEIDRVFDRIDHLLTGLSEDADEAFRFPNPDDDDDGPRAA